MSPLIRQFNSGKQIYGRDIADIVRATSPQLVNTRQVLPEFRRLAIIGEGKPHEIVAQLAKEADEYAFSPAINLNDEAEDQTILDKFRKVDGDAEDVNRDPTLSEGNYVVDISEMPGKTLGAYVGEVVNLAGASGVETTSALYAISRVHRTVQITAASEISPNIWKYTGKFVSLKCNPEFASGIAGTHKQPWVNIKAQNGTDDLPAITLYNRAEICNTAARVYRGRVALDDKLTGIDPIGANGDALGPVFVDASPHSFPATSVTGAYKDGGECWFFDLDNVPVLNCDDSGGESLMADDGGYGGDY